MVSCVVRKNVLTFTTTGSYYDEYESREIGSADDGPEHVRTEDDYDDGPWYLGRAKDEFNQRRRGRNVGQIDQEDDPVQVGYLPEDPAYRYSMLDCSGLEIEETQKTNAMEILVPKTTSTLP